MENHSSSVFYRIPYFLRTPLIVTVLVFIIYTVISFGHVLNISEIVLFTDKDISNEKLFWNLPKSIRLPWTFNGLLEMPIIVTCAINAMILIIKYLSYLVDTMDNKVGYLQLLSVLLLIALGLGFAFAGGEVIGNDLAGRSYNGLKVFLKCSGWLALVLSFLFGLSLHIQKTNPNKDGLSQDIAKSYIKLALSGLLFSAMTTLFILLKNAGLMTFTNSILLSILWVILIFSLGTIIGFIFGLILKYLSSLRASKVLSN